MKRLLLILIALLLMLSACQSRLPETPEDSVEPPAEVETESDLLLIGSIVNGEIVNIRQKPSIDGRVIDAARRGDMFEILDEENGWCQVRYRGDIAYISSGFLFQQQWEQEAKLLVGTVNDVGYNSAIYAADSTEAAIVLRAMKAECFVVSAAHYSEGWHQLLYKGTEVYIGAQCLDLQEMTINQALFP